MSKPNYKTSKDYKRLKELLDKGYEVVCLFPNVNAMGEYFVSLIKKDESVYILPELGAYCFENELFEFCKRRQVEFIEPNGGGGKEMQPLVIHRNSWPWGYSITLVTPDGGGILMLSFDRTNPGVCFLSSLSVIPNMRQKGVATFLMEEAERICRERDIFRIDLKSVMTDFVMDFYHKRGFVDIEEEDDLMLMYKLL